VSRNGFYNFICLVPRRILEVKEMSGEKAEYRNIAIGIGIASIIFIVGLAGYFTYYVGQDVTALNGVNDQKNALENYKSKLETWLAGNITQLQSQLDSLQSDYNTSTAPRLIGVLSTKDSRPADDTPYLHVFGNVVNVGKGNANDAVLYVEAFQGRVLTFNATISLGTINGESFATYVDEKVPYVGSELTTWHIWSHPYGIDWSWSAGT
jgi:hypothetical protein